MSEPTDAKFYDRADAIIHLANEQNKEVGKGHVSASLLYGTSRYNAFISAVRFENVAALKAARQETIDYFVQQYRAMLIENLDDYIERFDTYMQGRKTG